MERLKSCVNWSRYSKKVFIIVLLLPLVVWAGMNIDNLRLNGNTISSLNTNGDIVLNPNGTGGIQLSDETASRAIYLDANGEIQSHATLTDTELGFLDGVTSAIQTQMDLKAPLSSPTLTTPTTDIVTLDGQGSSPSNPSAGFYKFFVKDDGVAYLRNSAGTETEIGAGGAGAGSHINLAVVQDLNWDAETGDTTNFAESGGGTLATEATIVFQGEASISYDASANTDYMTFGPVEIISLDGNRCIASFWYFGFDANVTAQVWDGTSVLNSDVMAAATVWTRQEEGMSFTCSDATSDDIYIRIYATANAAIGYVDNAWVGENYFPATAASDYVFGAAKSAGTASCSWSTTSGTFAAFAADADCPAPTVYGSTASAPATKIPGITFANLAAGTYKVTAMGKFRSAQSASATSCGFQLYDGTTQSGHNFVGSGGANVQSNAPIVAVYNYAVPQSAITFQVRGTRHGGDGTCNVENDTSADEEFIIIVEKLTTNAVAAQTPFLVEATITGGNGTTADSATEVGIFNSALTLANSANATITAQISCTSTEEASGTTCTGNEGFGIAFTAVETVKHRVCFNFSATASVDAVVGAIQRTYFRVVMTGNTDQTPSQRSSQIGFVQHQGANGAGNSGGNSVNVCGIFSLTASTKYTFRLMYESTHTSGAGGSVQADASATNYDRNFTATATALR